MTNANRSHALCSGAALAIALVAGCSGSNGAPGQSGTNGTSCSVSKTDGGAVIQLHGRHDGGGPQRHQRHRTA